VRSQSHGEDHPWHGWLILHLVVIRVGSGAREQQACSSCQPPIDSVRDRDSIPCVQDYCRCSFSPALEARNCWTFVTEILYYSCCCFCGLHFRTPLHYSSGRRSPGLPTSLLNGPWFHRSIKKFLRPSRLWHGGAAAFIWAFAATRASCCKKPCPCVASFKSYSLPTYFC